MSLVVEQLQRRYAQVWALRDVSFDVPQGQIVGLIGPNGAGKTTLLRILSTFLSPTAGRVCVGGFDVATDPDHVRERLGYLPEQLPSDSVLRVGEYLDFRARLKRIDRRRRSVEVDRCLALCDLKESRHRLLIQLSQGFRRRVGLADALLGNPPVLLLDEPTIGLDPVQVRRTRDLLAELAGQTTVLVSTHLLAEAELLCERALVLLRGQLVSDVWIADLQSQEEIELELAVPADVVGTFLRTIAGVASVEASSATASTSRWILRITPGTPRETIASACQSQGYGLRELRGRESTLEEHLLKLILHPLREAA